MKIKVSKIILESAQLFRAKNDVRTYLNGICFKSDGRVCATDGHTLFIADKSEDNEIKSDIVLDVSKAPTKTYCHAIIDTELNVCFYYKQDEQVGASMAKSVDCERYPDVDRVTPTEERPASKIAFNGSYLLRAQKVAKLFNPRFETITFTLSGDKSSGLARFNSALGDKAMVVVMPVRI